MTRRTFGMIRKLPSGRHQASYLGPDKRRHTSWTTYLLTSDADAWLRKEELLIDRDLWTPPKGRKPVEEVDAVTVAEYARSNLGRRATRARKPLRPTTVDLYAKLLRLCIAPKLGDVALVDLTPAMVLDWHDSLPKDSPTQNGAAYQLLRSVLADAEEEELIERNPCRIKGAGKPAPKRKGKALNIGQLGVYAAHVRRPYLLALLLAAWCGLRSGEVRALRGCDVAADGTALRVEQAVTRIRDGQGWAWHFGPPKTGAGVRTIHVPPHLAPLLAEHLADWRERHDDPDALLFPARDGSSPLNTSTLNEAHKLAAKAAGVPDATLHDLRRTGATLASQSGATLKEVMRMLGHTQPGVAMVYQFADDQRDAERAKRMSALLPKPASDSRSG